MKKFQPIRYLKKHTTALVAFFAVLTVALYVVLSLMQSYTASTMIDYVYEDADQGKAPDGTELNTSEVYSSDIISRVMENLNIDYNEYSPDKIRSHILVEQVEDESITAVNEGLWQKGEESDLQPTEYIISFTADGDMGEEMARSVLDEIMDEYFTHFSTKYINSSSVVNTTSGINMLGYDYIEQMDIIEDALMNTVNSLQSRASMQEPFYSVDTGYAFSDLLNQFYLMQNVRVPQIQAYILQHRVSKDVDVLIDKYEKMIEAEKITQAQSKSRVSEVEGIIEAYVEMLRASHNTAAYRNAGYGDVDDNENWDNILNDVEYPGYVFNENTPEIYDQTTEYDVLLKNWIALSDEYESSVINQEYYDYLIACFSGDNEKVRAYQTKISQFTNQSASDTKVGVQGDYVVAGAIQSELTMDDIYTENTVPCTPEDVAYVETQIGALLTDMDVLYDLVARTDREFNDYLGAEYIKILSSTHVHEKIPVALYTILGAVLFMGISCLCVILLGRAEDIFEYAAYTDQQFRVGNRLACDRHIQNYAEKILPMGYACLLYQVLNHGEMNQKIGRKMTDEIISYLAEGIRNAFNEENAFIGYNGSGQFMVFVSGRSEEGLREELEHQKILLHEKLRDANTLLRFSVGIGVLDDRTQRIRDLITRAAKNKQEYEAGTAQEV